MPKDVPIVLVFGAMATGSITTDDHPYVSDRLFILIALPVKVLIRSPKWFPYPTTP